MKVMRNQASRLVLFIICLMYLIFYVDRVNISTAAPIMQKDLGLTATQLGIAFSAFAYPYAFFQIAGGWLGDRMGPRVTLVHLRADRRGVDDMDRPGRRIGGAVPGPARARHRRRAGLSRPRRARCRTGCAPISAALRKASPTPSRGSATRSRRR